MRQGQVHSGSKVSTSDTDLQPVRKSDSRDTVRGLQEHKSSIRSGKEASNTGESNMLHQSTSISDRSEADPADAGVSEGTAVSGDTAVSEGTAVSGSIAMSGGTAVSRSAGGDSPAPVSDSLALGSDSLAFRKDSLHATPLESWHFSHLDSLCFGWCGKRHDATSDVCWRDTSATALFGHESCLVQPERIERPAGASLTDNAVFQGFVLLLAATYATLLYRNLGDVKTLLNRISRESASGERLSEEPGASGFSRFLNVSTAIGMLFMGVIVVKYGDTLMPPELGKALSHGAVLALSLLATLAWFLIILFQSSAIRIAGAITLSQDFITQLALLRRTYFALAVLITSPPLLLFALCPRGTGGVWFICVAVELIITAVLYLKESLNLFISKKISILHWFLYLCTVEVFPISLLWLLVTR